MKTILPVLTTFLFLALFSTTAKAVSTGHIVGQVIEKETKRPVAYAEIIFENKMDKIVITANEYGFYYANHLPTGRYQMRVKYNNHLFVMNKVKVYDSYSSELNFMVSNNNELPEIVELIYKENDMSSVTSSDLRLTGNNNQPTESINELLSRQAGIDVRDGKLFVKGSDQVRFFIDGTPIMGTPSRSRIW